ncbi:conserved protein of unknown function [Tenacibaculum sp. 190130A14a]|uniref:Uncharacterized protein n=1 Tax=Tenacibaculum polynesiense TaxID=3137857 RepID=A0ABM9P6U7_9FLAO
MKIISNKHFEQMEIMCRNFEERSKNNLLFLPQHKVSKKINSLIRSIEKPTDLELNTIADLVKNIENIEHYGGSAWHDYKIHVNAILKENGFKFNII